MTLEFHHGISVEEVDDGLRAVLLNDQGILAFVGTAPDANASTFPLDTPVLLNSEPRKAKDLDPYGDGNGTLWDAVELTYKITGARIIIVRVAEGVDDAATRANILGSATLKTGLWALLKAKGMLGVKPKITLAPGFMEYRVTDGILDVVPTEQGAGYAAGETPAVTVTPEAGNTPTIPARIEAIMGTGANAGKVVEYRIVQPGEGYTDAAAGPTITVAAPAGGGTTATATVTVGTARNPVVAEFASLGDRLRTITYADCPGTTDAAAVLYRNDWDSKRIEIFEPKALVYDAATASHVAYPLSIVAAAIRAKVTKEKGFWHSKSNKPIDVITGASRDIDFNIADSGSQANYLNEQRITTLVHAQGWRLWGNRLTTTDASWTFEVQRLVADAVYDALEDSFLWAVDRPMNVNNIEEIVERVNAFIRYLVAETALIGGKAWIDPEINTADTISQGVLSVDFSLEGPPPIEHLRFRAHREPSAFTDLVNDVLIRIENL